MEVWTAHWSGPKEIRTSSNSTVMSRLTMLVLANPTSKRRFRVSASGTRGAVTGFESISTVKPPETETPASDRVLATSVHEARPCADRGEPDRACVS